MVPSSEWFVSTMDGRPPSDRVLDADTALAAVRDQLPALGCRRAEFLGSGWGNDVYRFDEHLVGRLPRTGEGATWVDLDEAVLRLVTSSLGAVLLMPAVVGRGRAGAHFPYDFLVCTLIGGVSADHSTAPASEELAADLGRALKHIHAVPVDEARRAGLREVH
jgi:aminoglycoside phosphotransferase (APT) family kinase protein